MRKRDVAKLLAVAVVPGAIPVAIVYYLFKIFKGAKKDGK